jgi:hypothetical protein
MLLGAYGVVLQNERMRTHISIRKENLMSAVGVQVDAFVSLKPRFHVRDTMVDVIVPVIPKMPFRVLSRCP